jgi:hypothetical protein
MVFGPVFETDIWGSFEWGFCHIVHWLSDSVNLNAHSGRFLPGFKPSSRSRLLSYCLQIDTKAVESFA